MLRRASRAGGAATLALLAVPATAAAHTLSGRVDSPLPLVAYLAGAAVAVGLSFAFVALTDAPPPQAAQASRVRTVPRWLRLGLRGIGLLAWLWIVAQAVVGGSSDADVASLFLWVYAWVGVAILSALVGPVWTWIDPFATLYDLLAAVGRRIGLSGWDAADLPASVGRWPAVLGFTFFIWLELVVHLLGGRQLGLVLVGYTLVTLAAMAYFGRDEWRARGETFNVWFGLLGRLAPYALEGRPGSGRVRRRGYGTGLLDGGWSSDLMVLAALGTGAILYDGLSQTPPFVDRFGFPDIRFGTVLLAVALGALAAVVLAVGRVVGLAAMGAGLVPVAVGYLVAHYLTAVLVDGQRILVALSDPLQQGWDLLGFAFFEPVDAWLPASLVWTVQLAAVVLGHVVGAWAGHAAAEREPQVRGRLGQVPLALVMVALTTATLWSLGQDLVFDPDEEAAAPVGEVAAATRWIETIASRPDQRAVSSAASTVRMTACTPGSASSNVAQPAETLTRRLSPRGDVSRSSRTRVRTSEAAAAASSRDAPSITTKKPSPASRAMVSDARKR